jgi:hypothetical protein
MRQIWLLLRRNGLQCTVYSTWCAIKAHCWRCRHVEWHDTPSSLMHEHAFSQFMLSIGQPYVCLALPTQGYIYTVHKAIPSRERFLLFLSKKKGVDFYGLYLRVCEIPPITKLQNDFVNMFCTNCGLVAQWVSCSSPVLQF